MLFENELISFDILDVVELEQTNVNIYNANRNFSSISYRFCGDTVLKNSNNECYCKDTDVCYVSARVDYRRIASKDKLIAVHFNTTNYSSQKIELFTPKNSEPFARLFSEILQCWNKKQHGYKYLCAAYLNQIFAECYTQNYVESAPISKIQNSINYINENFKNAQLTIGEIANKSFISEVYFRKLFKKQFGVSPQKYITNLRLQYAAGLISTGYLCLKEVADKSGYNDYKYFSTEFKKAFGLSPSQYMYNYDNTPQTL